MLTAQLPPRLRDATVRGCYYTALITGPGERDISRKKMLFNQLICRLTPVKPVQPKAPPGDRTQSQLPEGLTSALFLSSVLKTVVTSGSVLFGPLPPH